MMKQWYDGYTLEDVGSIYNPNSVMKTVRNNQFHSYWTETSASQSLMEYISLDFNGLSKTIAKLLGGIDIPMDTNGFANDLVTFRSRDDVLTLLIHLGYLAYAQKTSLYSLLHFLMCCGILCLYESEQQKPVGCSKRRG